MDWTVRCIHEARLWRHNVFVTLTYTDEQLEQMAADNFGVVELHPEHLVNFWKRLRQGISRDYTAEVLSDRSASVRYLACGQYGDRTRRPHYHACIFNADFADLVAYNRQKNLWESATLNAIWGHGATKLSPFEPARAGYVAGYATKTGPIDYYNEDGVVLTRPFLRASRNPAPGRTWLTNNHGDVQHGYTIIDGKRTRLPRYYLKKLLDKHETRARHEDLKAQPVPRSNRNDPARLAAAEIIMQQNQERKKRGL